MCVGLPAKVMTMKDGMAVVDASGAKSERTVILLEEIIERNIGKLFLSNDVVCAHPYRIMRNADLTIDEDEAEDLLEGLL